MQQFLNIVTQNNIFLTLVYHLKYCPKLSTVVSALVLSFTGDKCLTVQLQLLQTRTDSFGCISGNGDKR